MALLVIKMLVAPLLVASGSLAQRRWGPAVGGRIIGLPLTALPLLLLLTIADGRSFAAVATTADQSGGLAQAGWCLAYAVSARRLRPAASFAVATGTFAVLALATAQVPMGIAAATAVSAGAILLGLRLWPVTTGAAELSEPWRWELPVRMVVAAVFTFVLSESAGALGAHSAGLVGAFPLLTVILAVATHSGSGPVAADRFVHGVLAASWSVVAALAVLAVTITRLPVPAAFGLAVLAAVAAQALAPTRTRHSPRKGPRRGLRATRGAHPVNG